MTITTANFTTFSNVNDGGFKAWANPSNAQTSNNTRAAATSGSSPYWGQSAGNISSQQLKALTVDGTSWSAGTPLTITSSSVKVEGYFNHSSTSPHSFSVSAYIPSLSTTIDLGEVAVSNGTTDNTYTFALIAKSSNTAIAGTGASSGGTTVWANPSNITAQDSTNATMTPNATASNNAYLVATNFGFSIPSTNTITGVKATVRYKSSGNSGQANWEESAYLTKDGSTTVGSNQAQNRSLVSSYTDLPYGGASSLWGTTLTYSEVNASTFGFMWRIDSGAGTGQIQVDAISITVYHYNSSAIVDVGDIQDPAFYVSVKANTSYTAAYSTGATIGAFIDRVFVEVDASSIYVPPAPPSNALFWAFP